MFRIFMCRESVFLVKQKTNSKMGIYFFYARPAIYVELAFLAVSSYLCSAFKMLIFSVLYFFQVADEFVKRRTETEWLVL